MARYKVSYRVLRQQGEDMKAAAKMVDSYAERVGKIRGQLGNDNMLAEIRNNLQRLGVQLGESRAILNTAGELLIKNVESYNGVEVRQVKRVDSLKAHNRDFYKRPIVVASAGGAAAGAGAGAAASAAGGAGSPAGSGTTTNTTVNYTDNSVNVNYSAQEHTGEASLPGGMANIASQAEPPPAASPAAPAAAANQAPSVQQPASPVSSGAAPLPEAALKEKIKAAAGKVGPGAIAGVAAGAVAAGGVVGGSELKKRSDAKKGAAEAPDPGSFSMPAPAADAYDPEAELEKALKKVRDMAE